MYNITDKGINLLINSIEQHPDRYFWVRSPDYLDQIYVSERFETVWKQSNATLFEHPKAFNEAVIREENVDVQQLLQERVSGTLEQRERQLLVRLKTPQMSDIVYWRDSSFSICDTYGNIIGIAGIGEALSESEYYHELEDKVEEPSPLALLKQSQHARYLVTEKPKAVEFADVEIPCHRVKSRYYVLTHQGEVVLTRRELECVYCLLAGMTAKQTARHLSISPRTVEEYLNKIREKLGCQNKLEITKRIKHVVR